MDQINTLINEINQIKKNKLFDLYILQAKFPHFKNLEPDSIINFDFPLTAIVGPNGTGKSSILHALWGMPYGNSTSRFWFSTKIDPIEEAEVSNLGNIRYIYTFYAKAINKELSVRKIRTKKQLGYFEPTKPSVQDGMSKMPPFDKAHEKYRTDRWTPVKREVVYINSKCEVGVAERYFYQTEPGQLNAKLNSFAYEAERLKKVIDKKRTSSKPGGSEYVFANYLISDEALKYINQILSQNYIEARYLLHRYYDRSKAPTVIFKSKSREYSDTFAGSGELSIVTTVLKILAAKEYSLILLDEPETSLHPRAQVNLIHFLLTQIKLKKLQIVISTHSPAIVDALPKNAIKLLEPNDSGKSIIVENIDRSIVFNRIGHVDQNKIAVISEDQLLNEFVKFCVKQLDVGLQDKFALGVDSVGVDEIYKHHITSWLNSGSNVYLIVDGDQHEKLQKLPDLSNCTEQDKQNLRETLKKIGLSPAGIKNPEDLVKYVNWIKNRVMLINAECPEYIFLKTYGNNLANDVKPKTNKAYKKTLGEFLRKQGYDDLTAPEMNTIFFTQLVNCKNNGGIAVKSHVDYMIDILNKIIIQNQPQNGPIN